MKEEMNHLIEYYTVLKKAGQMIFGEEVHGGDRLTLNVKNKTDAPEDQLLRKQDDAGMGSDNSDDLLFGNENRVSAAAPQNNFFSGASEMNQFGVSIAYMSGTINQTE